MTPVFTNFDWAGLANQSHAVFPITTITAVDRKVLPVCPFKGDQIFKIQDSVLKCRVIFTKDSKMQTFCVS